MFEDRMKNTSASLADIVDAKENKEGVIAYAQAYADRIDKERLIGFRLRGDEDGHYALAKAVAKYQLQQRVDACKTCVGTKEVECFCVGLARTKLYREQGMMPGRHVDTLPSGRVGNAGPCPKCDGKLTHICPDCF
jgi:hypothetical protein